MRHAKAVFAGEVLKVREATKSEQEENSNAYIVRMRVERYWKGIKFGEINVETDMTGCGPYFRVGEKFLVYGMGKRLNTACSGTRKLEHAEEDLNLLAKVKYLNQNKNTSKSGRRRFLSPSVFSRDSRGRGLRETRGACASATDGAACEAPLLQFGECARA